MTAIKCDCHDICEARDGYIVTIFTNFNKTVLYFYGGFTSDFILILAT